MDKKALMEELEQLGKLYQAGVFSQAEFEAERAALYPNIVRVFDLDQDKGSGRWFLRMEYVEGEDLQKKLGMAS